MILGHDVCLFIVTFETDDVKLGVKEAFIIDGRVPHALFDEVLAGGEKGNGSLSIQYKTNY